MESCKTIHFCIGKRPIDIDKNFVIITIQLSLLSLISKISLLMLYVKVDPFVNFT